jgi:hypothetical protein
MTGCGSCPAMPPRASPARSASRSSDSPTWLFGPPRRKRRSTSGGGTGRTILVGSNKEVRHYFTRPQFREVVQVIVAVAGLQA